MPLCMCFVKEVNPLLFVLFMQWRAYTARDAYKKKRTALIMLQSAFRMRLERVRFLKYRAARLVQVRPTLQI
jgi:hypothetical protein